MGAAIKAFLQGGVEHAAHAVADDTVNLQVRERCAQLVEYPIVGMHASADNALRAAACDGRVGNP